MSAINQSQPSHLVRAGKYLHQARPKLEGLALPWALEGVSYPVHRHLLGIELPEAGVPLMRYCWNMRLKFGWMLDMAWDRRWMSKRKSVCWLNALYATVGLGNPPDIQCDQEAVAHRQGCHQLRQKTPIKFRRGLDIITVPFSDLIRNSSYHKQLNLHFKVTTIAKMLPCQRLAVNLHLNK